MKKSGVLLCAWISLVLGTAFAGIALSRTGSPARIGGAGEVYDFSYAQLTEDYDTVACSNHIYKVLDDEAALTYEIGEGAEPWRYLYVDIAGMNRDRLISTVRLLDEDGEIISRQTAEMVQGRNGIELEKQPFVYLELGLSGQKNLKFSLDAMQLRTEKEYFSGKRFLPAAMLFTLLCMFAALGLYYGVLRYQGKYSISVVGNFLQDKYALYGDLLGGNLEKQCRGKNRRFFRILLLMTAFFYLLGTDYLGMASRAADYRIHSVILFGFLVLLACLCWERPLRRINWEHGLFRVWFVLWGLTCVSDLLVEKRFAYVGYGMLIFWGFFYFIWGNMEKPDELLEDICSAVRWSFWLIALGSLIFHPYAAGYRYSGIFADPAGFAVYLDIALAAFLATFFRSKQSVCSGAGAALSAWLLWLTQSDFMILAGMVTLLLFVGCFLRAMICGDGKVRLHYFRAVFGAALLGAAAVSLWMWLSDRFLGLPGLGTVLGDESPVKAGKNMFELLKDKGWRPLLYSKFMVWKQYIRNLNFWGHSYLCQYHDKAAWPQNGILAVAYRYGILAVVPYVTLAVLFFQRVWKKVSAGCFGYFPLLYGGAFWILNLFCDVEKPYLEISWIVYFLVFGWAMAADSNSV